MSLTVKEIAGILKFNPHTIRNWIDAGTLPHVRVGERRVRVSRSDFEILIASHYNGPTYARATPSPAIWGARD